MTQTHNTQSGLPQDLPATCKKYTQLSATGRVLSCYERLDSNSEWVDATAVAIAQQAAQQAAAELRRERMAQVRAARRAEEETL